MNDILSRMTSFSLQVTVDQFVEAAMRVARRISEDSKFYGPNGEKYAEALAKKKVVHPDETVECYSSEIDLNKRGMRVEATRYWTIDFIMERDHSGKLVELQDRLKCLDSWEAEFDRVLKSDFSNLPAAIKTADDAVKAMFDVDIS